MIQEVIGKGYHLVPIGFMPKKGANPAFDREWRIEFPEAERYLETCLSDTQLRCHIFCLLLFQVRFWTKDPIKALMKVLFQQVFFKIEHSVTEDHLRHVVFWQAENLTLAWANYEMFNNIRAVYESLIERLSRKVYCLQKNLSMFTNHCICCRRKCQTTSLDSAMTSSRFLLHASAPCREAFTILRQIPLDT